MKLLIVSFFAFLCCFTFADGLKCVTSFPHVDQSTKECNDDVKYCFTFNGKMETLDYNYDGTVQNCAFDIAGSDALCKQKGDDKFDYYFLKGSIYCCDSDLCNSAPKTLSIISVSAFVLITKFLFL